MIPKRVLLENFLSFGEATTIEFTDDQPLWVLGGPNGVGKSAVFDAMTYCLFGSHRGGNQDADSLIRHGANGMRVEFDFEFDGVDYRISRSRMGRPIQSVKRRDPKTGEWTSVPGVNSVPEVKAWAQNTLGMGFDAFTASVLLRQGEADAIITANGKERGKILRKIIDADRFDVLHKRVAKARLSVESDLKSLNKRREVLRTVTENDLLLANEGKANAVQRREAALLQTQQATSRVEQAKQWAALDADRRQKEARIAEADARAANGERIRADKARLDELAVVSDLQRLIEVRQSAIRALADSQQAQAEVDRLNQAIAALDTEIASARADHETFRARGETDRARLSELRNLVDRERSSLKTAERRAELVTQLSAFAGDLPAQLESARVAEVRAKEEQTRTSLRVNETQVHLKGARDRQSKLNKLEVGADCSNCGQKVTAEHAEKERRTATEQVERYSQELQVAVQADKQAADAVATASKILIGLVAVDRERDQVSQKISELDKLGLIDSPEVIRQRLKANELEVTGLEAAQKEVTAKLDDASRRLKDAEAKRRSTEADRQAVQKKWDDAERRLGTATMQRLDLLSRLTPTWADRADSITVDEVTNLEREYSFLQTSGVVEQFDRLQKDCIVRAEWVADLEQLTAKIAAIDERCRVAVAVAQADSEKAVLELSSANKEHDLAAAAADQLHRDHHSLNEMIAGITTLERQVKLHRLLEDALGSDGIQRDLVRSAEVEIVRHANDTIRKLSDGDLSIELDNSGEDSEAFDLRVRRAESPTPVEVTYLSGSQKFRVAVSVALAIGRFAAGHSRRLESVIIDEGFGSLDRDGLLAMAEELNRLKGYLRRIILVSHQDEFTEKFPVVIRLSRGENGTIAEAIRR